MQIEHRDIQDWNDWPQCVTSLEKVPDAPNLLSFYREGNSHRTIGRLQTLRKLSAKGVNEAFLQEISTLANLEYLEMETVTAENLLPLTHLRNLRTLKLAGVRKATDFEPLVKLPALKRLFVENAKHLHSLEFLAAANHLSAIGVEGSLWTNQNLDCLAPLSNLVQLEGLFLTSVVLREKSLWCLSQIPRLRVLECARFAPRSEFELLRRLKPDLECRWCDEYEISEP